MKKTIPWAPLFLAAALFSTSGVSYAHYHDEGWEDGMPTKSTMEKLDLTDLQKKKIEDIRQTDDSKFDKIYDRKTEAKDALREDFKNNASDSTLEKHYEQILDAKRDYAELCFKKNLEVRKVLTAEQRKKMHEIREEE